MARSGSSKFVRRGKDVLGGGPSKFVSIQPDSTVQIAPMVGMDELISVDLHGFWDVNPAVLLVCLGKDCPSCELGNEPGFKGYLPVATKDSEAKIFSFGIGVARDLNVLEEEVGSLKGKVIKIKRTGAGLKSRYAVVNTGRNAAVDSLEMPDIESTLGPFTRAEHITRLQDAGLWAEGGSKKAAAEEEDAPFELDDEDEFGSID